jgi:hypothetical protein
LLVDLDERATATDAVTTANVVFDGLVDDPASAADITDAYLGEIMLEAASAIDTITVPSTYDVAIIETVTAAETGDGTIVTVPASTFNPSDKSANVTLSNGNLTVGASTSADGGVRSTLSKAAGKVYFEYTIVNIAGADTGVGIAKSTASLTAIGPSATGAVNIYGSGSIYFNGADTGKTIGGSVGTVCIAVDITGGLFWARWNGGSWNANSGTANNPATGVGGINIAAVFPTNAVFASVSTNNTANNITVNFGAAAFAQTVPSGFTAWDSL